MIQVSSSFSETPLCIKLSDVDPEWFFSEDLDEIKLAQSICSNCPIRLECLDWAIGFEMEERYVWGVYGGLTSWERLDILS